MREKNRLKSNLPHHVDATRERSMRWKLRFGSYWTCVVKAEKGVWAHHGVVIGPARTRLFYFAGSGRHIEESDNIDFIGYSALLQAIVLNDETRF